MIDLTNKKFMITGASSGIGRATAIMLSELGAKIVACGRDEQRLAETLSRCNAGEHIKISFDVRDTASYNEVFRQATADGQKLDGLIYCAGIAPPTPLRVMSEETIREVLDVNLIGFLMMTATYVKRMFSDGGSIVAISSVNSHYPHKCMSAYAASKLGLEGATRTLALELADKNIRINCVIAGPVQTEMAQSVLPTSSEQIHQHALLGVLKPEDIAHAIIFLLSDASSGITGRSMYVDGGYLGQ